MRINGTLRQRQLGREMRRLRACRLVFDRLRSAALSPQDPVALIERLAVEL